MKPLNYNAQYDTQYNIYYDTQDIYKND